MENLHDKQSEANEELPAEETKHLLAEVVFFARQNHDQERHALIDRLRLQRQEELIRNFLIEMDAKNRAYFLFTCGAISRNLVLIVGPEHSYCKSITILRQRGSTFALFFFAYFFLLFNFISFVSIISYVCFVIP